MDFEIGGPSKAHLSRDHRKKTRPGQLASGQTSPRVHLACAPPRRPGRNATLRLRAGMSEMTTNDGFCVAPPHFPRFGRRPLCVALATAPLCGRPVDSARPAARMSLPDGTEYSATSGRV
jgi:hypothetical protein